MIVLNRLDIAIPVGDVCFATARFAGVIQTRDQPRGRETMGYEIFYLSSCFLGLATALMGQPRRWELATYASFGVGTLGHLYVEVGHFDAAKRHAGTPLGRRQWWLGVAGVAVCGLQISQWAHVVHDGCRTRLAILGAGTRAFGLGALLAARWHKSMHPDN
jgi:hypothetical protein